MKLILAALTDAERERAAECVHESGAVACVLARPRLADVYVVLESG